MPTQLNVSIFARSTYELSFNLYPLKAGWQSLPEFEVKYNTQYDEKSSASAMAAEASTTTIKPAAATMAVEVNQELHHLTQRWMPKKVFVLVSFVGRVRVRGWVCALIHQFSIAANAETLPNLRSGRRNSKTESVFTIIMFLKHIS